ncbi:MAG: tRNA modification GTPase [Planctomycetaceae bacterium]
MPLLLDDTIAAIASPPGAAKRGIIRISGDQAITLALSGFTIRDNGGVAGRHGDGIGAEKHVLPYRLEGFLRIDALGHAIPCSAMVWPTRRSFTGQPMAELHLPGATPLMDAVLEDKLRLGARMAGRGEFTMRAFLAGRIDLIQAEAVLGVIDATDHAELQQALTQLGGGITKRLSSVRQNLIQLLGDLEAGLDFVEEDIEFITCSQILERLASALDVIQTLSKDSSNRLPSGYRRRVLLAGIPNAGKSTLFNHLAGSQKAIVSPIAGTTRDYLLASVILGKTPVDLIDTAGWEVSVDTIMQTAQQKRGQQIESADLIVWCTRADISPQELELDTLLRQQLDAHPVPVLHVWTQVDRNSGTKSFESAPCTPRLEISVAEGRGERQLVDAVESQLLSATSSRGELLGSTASRCRDSLHNAATALKTAIHATQSGAGDELISVEIRHCLHAVGMILGDVYTDDILDHIFSSFCIGK